MFFFFPFQLRALVRAATAPTTRTRAAKVAIPYFIPELRREWGWCEVLLVRLFSILKVLNSPASAFF